MLGRWLGSTMGQEMTFLGALVLVLKHVVSYSKERLNRLPLSQLAALVSADHLLCDWWQGMQVSHSWKAGTVSHQGRTRCVCSQICWCLFDLLLWFLNSLKYYINWSNTSTNIYAQSSSMTQVLLFPPILQRDWDTERFSNLPELVGVSVTGFELPGCPIPAIILTDTLRCQGTYIILA